MGLEGAIPGEAKDKPVSPIYGLIKGVGDSPLLIAFLGSPFFEGSQIPDLCQGPLIPPQSSVAQASGFDYPQTNACTGSEIQSVPFPHNGCG